MKKSFIIVCLLMAIVGCESEGVNAGRPIIQSNEEECTINPTLETEDASEITDTSAKLTGIITAPTCESTVTSQGFVYATSTLPKIDDNVAEVNGQNVSVTITNLEPNKTYYFRTFFTNPTGTYYGNENTFSTNIGNTIITTQDVTNITSFTAKSGGDISSDGGSAITSRGVCWNTTGNPTISDNITEDGDGAGSYESNMDGLEAFTEYYIKAYAINENGTVYGEEKTFTTLPTTPEVITSEITNIKPFTATSGGDVLNDGGESVTSYGVIWATFSQDLSLDNNEGITNDGNGIGVYSSELTGLVSCRTYYLRAYARNSRGTAYGEILSFTTSESGSPGSGLTDIDGATYQTVIIGNQEWMADNLNVSRYRNGDIIPQVTSIIEWGRLTTGAWCYFNNDPSNEASRGKLYNWHAVNDPRGLAPEGWHVPDVAEIEELAEFLGGREVAGGQLKSIGTIAEGTGLWESPNTDATNCTGFNGIPGGYRGNAGGFDPEQIKLRADYWTSEEFLPTTSYTAHSWNLYFQNAQIGQPNILKDVGSSVRCVKD